MPMMSMDHDVVRISVKKYDESQMLRETKRFSVDPSLTTYKVLRELLSKAFQIDIDFVVSYLMPKSDPSEDERYLPMMSDWDLNAAIYAASQPMLMLKVDLKPIDRKYDEWDIIDENDVLLMHPSVSEPQFHHHHHNNNNNNNSSMGNGSNGTHNHHHHHQNVKQQPTRYSSALAMAAGLAASAMSVGGSSNRSSWMPNVETMLAGPRSQRLSSSGRHSSPLDDCEWRSMLDSEGRLICHRQLRLQVYQRGVQPHLRSVVWRHLLNVYPHNMSGEERIAYTKELGDVYQEQKHCWQGRLRSGRSTEELRLIANAVRKDVVRTDRLLPFYAGDENTNPNLLSLFNILTTYALCHPDVTYCQGMSDLCSPLLYVLHNEAQTYIAFCALMRRLKVNFSCDGRSMTKKFQHLSELLMYYDPVFYEYLREMHTEDLLFAYRWLLLELKREFMFTDCLRVLEVMWASLPPDPPEGNLQMFQVDLNNCDDMPFSPSLLHLPTNRAARLMSFMCMNAADNACAASTTSIESTNSVQGDEEGSDDSSQSEDDNTFLNATFGFNAARVPVPASGHHVRVHSLSSTRTLQHTISECDNTGTPSPAVPIYSSVIPVPGCSRKADAFSRVRETDALPVAHSCPGNLNGLCHASVIRHLMLGNNDTSRDDGTGTSMAHHPATTKHNHELECVNTSSSTKPAVLVTAGKPPLTVAKSATTSPVPKTDRNRDSSQQPTPSIVTSTSSRTASSGSCSPVLLSQRHIKPSNECHVSDTPEPPQQNNQPKTSVFRRKLSAKKNEKLPSPIPLATEARQMSQSDGIVLDQDLTLTDIYDICVGQVDDSDSRSRQVSGDRFRGTAGSENARSERDVSSKSRHASSAQSATVTNPSIKDSGYSGTSTPMVKHGQSSPWKRTDDRSAPDSMLSNAGSYNNRVPTHNNETNEKQALLAGDDDEDQSLVQTTGDALHSCVDMPTVNSFIAIEHNYLLPPPSELGDGNPLLMFICLTLLLEHRDHIIKHDMDFNDIAIYFDKLSRSHNAQKVLRRARRLYKDYLSSHAVLSSSH